MPSVHRRSRSPFYHASFCGPDGRWLLRSTKQTDKTKAFAVALQWDRAAKLAKRGELVEAQPREVVGDIMKHADIGETLQAISIEEHFREWLDTKKARRSAGTAERYQIVVDRFLDLLGSRASKPLTALMPRDVGRFLDSRLQEGVAPAHRSFRREDPPYCLERGTTSWTHPDQPGRSCRLAAGGGCGAWNVQLNRSKAARGHGHRRMEKPHPLGLLHGRKALRLLPNGMGQCHLHECHSRLHTGQDWPQTHRTDSPRVV